MKEIPLTRGLTTIIDDEDYYLVKDYIWCARKGACTYYAQTTVHRNGRRRPTQMHILITGYKIGRRVDHINGNGLDNRRSNLRIATSQQNNRNRKICNLNTSGFKGVRLDRNKWRADIRIDGKRKNLGRFVNPEAAAAAYDEAARKYFGEFATLNFPKSGEQSAHRK